MSKNDSGSIQLDARGIPTPECPNCGNRLLKLFVCFDDDYQIGQYLLDAECGMCETKLTAPTILDHPQYDPADSRWW